MDYNLRITRAAKRMPGLNRAGSLLIVFLILCGQAKAACTAGFTYSASTGTVTFTNTTTGVSSAADYFWNFGDGSSSGTKNPVYTYNSSGVFLVSVTVRDSVLNCSDYYEDSVHVTGVCKAAFTVSVPHEVASLYASNGGSGASYAWKFGDGASATTSNQHITHTYASSGNYTICLTTTSGTCTDSFCKQIYVPGPNPCDADFSWSLGTNGQVTFTNNSTTPSGGITQYYWDFGDGQKGTDKDPVYTYGASGDYSVTLWISDSNSTGRCWDDFTDSIKVTGACNAGFQVDNTNALDVSFYPTHRGFNSYEWSFGDGSTSTDTDAEHTYTSAGNYTVCLIVYGDSGCADSVCKSIVVSATGTRSITGFVLLEDTMAFADTGVAYLIYYDPTDSTLNAVDTAMFDSDTSRGASFVFKNLKKGDYLVKAALIKSSVFYKDFHPTYADSARKWKDATTITVDHDQYVWITLQKGKNKGGKGFIGGKVAQGANKKEGDPLENIEVMLIDKGTNEPAAYTYSDVNGNFSFSNLALGTYEVYTEVTGLPTIPAVVTLSEATPTVDNITVSVSSSGVTTSIAFKAGDVFTAPPKLYPNPVRNTLYLSMEVKTASKGTLTVIDYSGKILLTKNLTLTAGEQTLEVPTDQWPAGLYLLRLDAPGGAQAQYRFVKID